MRALFFILTISFHLLCILTLKFLDDFKLIIMIFCGCLISGLIIKLTVKNKKDLFSNIGWGLFYGSITSLIMIIIFSFWLTFALSK